MLCSAPASHDPFFFPECYWSNDNYGANTRSRITLAASAGEIHWIAVASKSSDPTKLQVNPGASGPFQLTWYPTPPPGFSGAQFSPSSAVPGTRILLTGTNFMGATALLFNGARASFTNAWGDYSDLRITAVVPPDATSGPITILTPHGDATSSTAFRVLPPRLSVALKATGMVELNWPASSDAFVLESSASLSSPSWGIVAGQLVKENGTTKVAISPATGQRYYRLRTR